MLVMESGSSSNEMVGLMLGLGLVLFFFFWLHLLQLFLSCVWREFLNFLNVCDILLISDTCHGAL